MSPDCCTVKACKAAPPLKFTPMKGRYPDEGPTESKSAQPIGKALPIPHYVQTQGPAHLYCVLLSGSPYVTIRLLFLQCVVWQR